MKPHFADFQNLLAARELELGAAEADDDVLAVRVLRARSGLPGRWTRARALHGLAYEWRMPDDNRSAPAQESILFCLIT